MTALDIVLAHPVRTAIGTYNGALKAMPAAALGAIAIRETLRRASLDGEAVGSVTMGNVIQAGNRMNPARQAAIGGGLPVSVPAMTINRVCGSGAQAIVTAALEIASGEHDFAIAGGMAEGLDLIGPLARPATTDAVLSNGFGFGGVNASVIFGRVADAASKHAI